MRLDELNVINIENIEKYVDGFLPNIEYEPAKKWFQKSVRNLLINDEKYNTRIAQVSPTAPDWMKQRYKENIPLYRFSPSGDLTTKLAHIVDWINSVYQVSQEKVDSKQPKAAARQQLVTYAGKLLGSLPSIDLKTLLAPKSENVRHHVDDWFDSLNKFVNLTGDKNQEMTSEDMHHVIDYDNGAWVELKSEKSLGIEGKLMGHCVGGYASRVAGGETKIFSLRDNDNQPHVTVEVTNGKIVQVKGKGNKPPVEKYVQYVKDFLNKMHFPPTSGSSYFGSGERDIRQIGLRYNPENQTYGTLKEVAKLDYTTVEGFEILSLPEADDSSKVEYLIWKDDKMYGKFYLRYRSEYYIQISSNDSDRENSVTEQTRNIYKQAVEFLDKSFVDFRISDNEKFGFYRVSKEDSKFYDIDYLKVLQKFSNGMEVKKIYDAYNSHYEYVFINPLAPITPNSYKYVMLTIDEQGQPSGESDSSYKELNPVIEQEMADFLNENKVQPKDERDYFRLLNPIGLIWSVDDKKYKTYIDDSRVVANFSSDTTMMKSSAGIYRLYEGHKLLLQFTKKYNGFTDLQINPESNFRKYTKQFVNFLNENNLTAGGYDSKTIKNKLKDYGITSRGEKWHVGKTKVGTTGWSVEKVGSKRGNIITPDGKKVGELKFDSATDISQVDYLTSDEDLRKQILEFLKEYGEKNTMMDFTNSSLGSNAKRYGFIVHNNKVAKIDEVYPSEEIPTVDNMVWKKKAMITKSDDPDSGYKFGLFLPNGKLAVKLNMGRNSKEVVDVTIANPNYNPDEDRDSEKLLSFTETNIAPYINALKEIFKKENFIAKGIFLSKAGLQLRNGELQVIDDNPKVRGFINGKIQYEDGTYWENEKSRYDKDRWDLKKEDAKLSRGYSSILTCTVTENGISKIEVLSDEARKKPSLYRGYLNDMLDIVEEMNADSENADSETADED